MRIVYLFRSKQYTNDDVVADLTVESANSWAFHRVPTQGLHWIWEQLLKDGAIDNIITIVNNCQSPGYVRYGDNNICYVIPNINQIKDILRPDDVVVLRSYGRNWSGGLFQHIKNHRVYWYNASAPIRNSKIGREISSTMTAILEDCNMERPMPHVNLPRVQITKPVRPDTFFYKEKPLKYDLCIGASIVCGKKGQKYALNAVVEYKRLYGKNLKCIVPGPWSKGVKKNFDKIIKEHDLDVDVPGSIPIRDMPEIYWSSRLFVHMGLRGQNDRSVLEAMACGCPMAMRADMILHHAPYTYRGNFGASLIHNHENAQHLAEHLHKILEPAQRTNYDAKYNHTYQRQSIALQYKQYNERDRILQPWKDIILKGKT